MNDRILSDGKEFSLEFKNKNGEVVDYNTYKKEKNEIAIKKYMPIGTVVNIQQNNTLYMIIGFNYVNNGVEYDYVCCEYPYGVSINSDLIFLNHEQIEGVYNIGYFNKQGEFYKEELNKRSR